MKLLMMYGAGLCIVIAIGIGAYKLQRWWNWNMNYKDQVDTLIKHRVKVECLR